MFFFYIHRAPSQILADLPGQFSFSGQIYFCTGQQQLILSQIHMSISRLDIIERVLAGVHNVLTWQYINLVNSCMDAIQYYILDDVIWTQNTYNVVVCTVGASKNTLVASCKKKVIQWFFQSSEQKMCTLSRIWQELMRDVVGSNLTSWVSSVRDS